MKNPISVLYALALALTLFGCKADYSDLESTVFDIPSVTSDGVYESLNESVAESETNNSVSLLPLLKYSTNDSNIVFCDIAHLSNDNFAVAVLVSCRFRRYIIIQHR